MSDTRPDGRPHRPTPAERDIAAAELSHVRDDIPVELVAAAVRSVLAGVPTGGAA